LHALIGLSLHVLALAATFGSTAHTFHFLINSHLLPSAETAHLATLLASFVLCFVATSTLSILILKSALVTWRDANKRIHMLWLSDNTVALTPADIEGQKDELASEIYHPAKGSYNNHFCLVLALSDVSPQPHAGKTKRLVLARDAISDDAFRLLRVWMQLQNYRSSGSDDVDQVSLR